MNLALDRDRSLLLVVDVQERLHPAIHDGARVLEEVLRLVRVARLLGVPVFATEHAPQAIGPLLPGVASLTDRIVRKTHFDACGEAAFLPALPKERPEILLCGTEAHVCVLQTALGLRAAGRRVRVARDAIGSRRPASVVAALDRMDHHGIEAVTVEMAAFEWTRDAADPRFKDVLRLVK
ncbi:MAG: isochorismatase family protein [Acetobacteraceae bacterium]|nr:isochorismatase family protein [Acetobacteraceae bacterium]